ncbi:hypothetical protein HaLaN_24750 [Haematococcus lacustris]|uniref:Uncharacterized protein n=1 Tax=Haematococcus lacustris TaxID=44745 RepID=A0A6A0A2U2_HAELA|nr:hypothetical protein HaLaN_24750 [Haematococcus lacustris]
MVPLAGPGHPWGHWQFLQEVEALSMELCGCVKQVVTFFGNAAPQAAKRIKPPKSKAGKATQPPA